MVVRSESTRPKGGRTGVPGRRGGGRPSASTEPSAVEMAVEKSVRYAPLQPSTSDAPCPAGYVEALQLYSTLQQPLRLYSSTALQRSTLYNLCTHPLERGPVDLNLDAAISYWGAARRLVKVPSGLPSVTRS